MGEATQICDKLCDENTLTELAGDFSYIYQRSLLGKYRFRKLCAAVFYCLYTVQYRNCRNCFSPSFSAGQQWTVHLQYIYAGFTFRNIALGDRRAKRGGNAVWIIIVN